MQNDNTPNIWTEPKDGYRFGPNGITPLPSAPKGSKPIDEQQTMWNLPRDGYAFNHGALVPSYTGSASARHAASSTDSPPGRHTDPEPETMERQLVFYCHTNAPTAAQFHQYFMTNSAETPRRLPPRFYSYRIHSTKKCHKLQTHRGMMCIQGILAQYPSNIPEEELNWCKECAHTRAQRQTC